MRNILGKKLIAHRQTKTFTVHTSTVVQLKANTLPKPSTPCYYCDIFNLSLPMTGLMIMFPVLFQPQITANSVIKGLLWPLCQPSSGPLTVSWPEASLLKAPACVNLWVQRAYGNLEGTAAASPDFQVAVVVAVKSVISRLIAIFNVHFFCIAFLLELSLTDLLIMNWTGHLNQVPLFWLDPLPRLYLGWKDLSSHFCPVPAFCLTTCLVVALATLCCIIDYALETQHIQWAKSSPKQTEKPTMGRKDMGRSFKVLYTIRCYKKGDFCKRLQCFHLIFFLAYTF